MAGTTAATSGTSIAASATLQAQQDKGDVQAHSAGSDPNKPHKRINSPQDLEIFTQSKLCQQLVAFVTELSESVKGIPVTEERLKNASPFVRGLVDMLQEIEQWIEEIPPINQPMRFGNKAFCKWHARLVERGPEILLKAIAQATPSTEVCMKDLAAELVHYLYCSFGDERRIDYGTGHEASFIAILFALGSRGVLAKSDATDVVLLVFATYVRVMRRLQTVYVLEPAGSHGVWGLDDFHALPFLFGAAQLIGMEEEVPTGEVYHDRIVRIYADKFLYVDAIRQVLLSKKGAPFHETSPMLYDITGVPTWSKTQQGLIKMYRAEVLGKFPVIQHFLFGPSIQWPGDIAPAT